MFAAVYMAFALLGKGDVPDGRGNIPEGIASEQFHRYYTAAAACRSWAQLDIDGRGVLVRFAICEVIVEP